MLEKIQDFGQVEKSIKSITQDTGLKRNFQIIDLNKLKKNIQNKNCFMYSSAYSVVIFSPYYDFFEVFLYLSDYSVASDDLKNAISALESYFKENGSNAYKYLKFSACCKNDFENSPIYEIIRFSNFKKINSIARYVLLKNSDTLKMLYEFVPEQYRRVEFANVEDADDIMSLMLANFDVMGDSVPERIDLIENTKKKQVLCVKYENQLIAFHYFEVINNIYYGLFDCTHKKYRKYFVQFAIANFLYIYNQSHKIEYSRCYGWRDSSKSRLNSFAKNISQQKDGVVIFNYKYTLNI